MIDFISKLVCKRLRDAANKIEKGECELNKDDACKILSVIAHEAEYIKQAMLDYYNIADEGENAAYTIAYIAMKML